MLSITIKDYDQVSFTDLNDKFQVSYMLIVRNISIFTFKCVSRDANPISESFSNQALAEKRYVELYSKSKTYKAISKFSKSK